MMGIDRLPGMRRGSKQTGHAAQGRLAVPSGMAEAEALFRALRQRPPACEAAFRSALAGVAPQGADAVLRAGIGTVQEIERLAAAGYDHPYHNRYHYAEATLAMGWLGALAVEQQAITREAAALGVLAMAGHDIGHDGSRCLDGSLEAKSAAIMDAITAAAGLDEPSRALVHDLILASTPAGVQPVRGAVRPATARSLLCRLAREADVFASLMPCLGVQLGFALRREWRAAGEATADDVVSFVSRCRFLKAYSDHTEASDRIGLSAGVRQQLGALQVVAVEAGGEETSLGGAAVLDRLRPVRASNVYHAALERAPAA